MKKKTTPTSAEPTGDAIVTAKKPRARKTKTAEPASAAVEAPETVIAAEATPEDAPKPKKARAPRKKKTDEPAPEPVAVEAEPVAVEPALEIEAEEEEPAAREEDDDEILIEDEDLDESDEDEDDEDEEDDEELAIPSDRPAPKLERLQKILSQAGIASRRHAEELIEAGRVQVNGEVVNTLGAKADINRDHIRVDGKLLQGVERHRYFMLNKPKGYVTTVSDPEGRPTVMQFFDKAGERLYPVGRLDYLSEGLLLVTNDGELANLLTKAGSGVEKTYLVKVSGQPTEEELEELRNGVHIERAEPGSGRVRTSPARIRQVREGDNPWFEVVLIEGRNRELRKMFTAIGHFVEKIRRIAYGPLVLDLEPGKVRELDASEVEALRLTALGKLKPRRIKTTRMLPKEAGRSVDHEADKRGRGGKFGSRKPFRSSDDRPAAGKSFRPGGDKPFRKPGDRPAGNFDRSQGRPGFGAKPSSDRPRRDHQDGEAPRYGAKPGFQRDGSSFDRPRRPRFEGEGQSFGSRPSRPRFDRGEGTDRPRPARPRFDREEGGDRPRRPRFEGEGQSFGSRPSRPRFDRGEGTDRPRPARPRFDREEGGDRPAFRPRPQRDGEEPRRGGGRPSGKPFGAKPFGDRPRSGGARPASGGRPSAGGGRKPGFGGPRSGGGSRPGGGFKPRGGGRPAGGPGRRPGGGKRG